MVCTSPIPVKLLGGGLEKLYSVIRLLVVSMTPILSPNSSLNQTFVPFILTYVGRVRSLICDLDVG